MTKIWLFLFGTIGVSASLIGCTTDKLDLEPSFPIETNSSETISDQVAERKGIISEDDAEVLIYKQLSDKEKQTVIVDYTGTVGTKYLIRTLEKVNGTTEIREEYTVDFETGKVMQLK